MDNPTIVNPGELLSFTVPTGDTVTLNLSGYVLFVATKIQGAWTGSGGDSVTFEKNSTLFAATPEATAAVADEPINADIWMLFTDTDVLRVICTSGASAQGFVTGFWWAPAS